MFSINWKINISVVFSITTLTSNIHLEGNANHKQLPNHSNFLPALPRAGCYCLLTPLPVSYLSWTWLPRPPARPLASLTSPPTYKTNSRTTSNSVLILLAGCGVFYANCSLRQSERITFPMRQLRGEKRPPMLWDARSKKAGLVRGNLPEIPRVTEAVCYYPHGEVPSLQNGRVITAHTKKSRSSVYSVI